MTVETFTSPEHGVQAENYLNLYHGIENVDRSKITHFASLSQDEKSNFEAFEKQVQGFNFAAELGTENHSRPDSMTILRFLQADDYDADKAFKRIVATLKWHQQVQLGPTIATPPEKLAIYRKIRVRACMGRSKDGMPVFVERLAGFMNGIPSAEGKSLTTEDWVQCFLYDTGSLIRELRDSYTINTQSDLPVSWKAVWIMDCRGQSLFKAMKAMTTVKMLDSITEPNFPEVAGPIYLVNAPSVVAGIWKMAKAFLDPATVAKISIHSNVPKDVLLERMEETVLLKEYGGTNASVEFPKSNYV